MSDTPGLTPQVRADLESLRRYHHVEDGDCWYSCPKSGQCCNDREAKDFCTCGADSHNAALERVLAALGAVQKPHTVPVGEGYAPFSELRQRHPAEATLRRLLAVAHDSGSSLYGDDGELQDGRWPWIDYQRDSVADIERKIHERGLGKLLEAGIAKSPDGAWLILFDDAEVKPELFAGTGAESGAGKRFKDISDNWNAHLFVRVASNSRDAEL